ncbi:hypothetical protein BGZ73_007392 [Actinomortierella ambigua]|nr:hypothetical protein BGZ73_007392 [Actinomortierella ambigua]
MSDSDEAPPPTKKRVQPRPRRIARTSSGSNASQSDVGDKSRRLSGNSLKSPLSSQTSRDEDDFFMKSKNFHELKNQARADIPTEKDLEAAAPSPKQLETEDLDVIPIFDFEDEAKRDKELEVAKEREASVITKRKRELSLTPPPELPKRVFDTIPTRSRGDSMFQPIMLGDENQGANQRTTIDILDLEEKDQDTGLDPELASVAAKVTSASAGSGATDRVHQIHSPVKQQLLQDPPKEVNVLLRHLRYQWESAHIQPHELTRLTTDVKIAMNDNDPFKSMMQFYAMHKMMRPSDLIFTYRNMRLLPSATPRSLSMPSVVVLDIYTEAGYKFMRQQADEERARWLLERSQQEDEASPSKNGARNVSIASDDDNSVPNDAHPATVQQDEDGEDQENSEDSEFLFIKIRGKDTTDERMRVKKSTTVAAISNAYKKLKKIAANTIVRLEFDDETLPPQSTMADTDVEDDDMLTATLVNTL